MIDGRPRLRSTAAKVVASLTELPVTPESHYLQEMRRINRLEAELGAKRRRLEEEALRAAPLPTVDELFQQWADRMEGTCVLRGGGDGLT